MIHTSVSDRCGGAAMNTTSGANSAVRNIFSACGSTSSIAIFPS